MRISDWSSDVCSSDLAAAAQAAPAADRIDVDAQAARRLQDRRADREAAAPPRGGEDDEGAVPGSPVCVVGQGQAVRSLAAPAAALAAAAFPPPRAGRASPPALPVPAPPALVGVHTHFGRHVDGRYILVMTG